MRFRIRLEVEPAGFAEGLDVEKREREGSRSGMTLRIGLEVLGTWGEGGFGEELMGSEEFCGTSYVEQLSRQQV